MQISSQNSRNRGQQRTINQNTAENNLDLAAVTKEDYYGSKEGERYQLLPKNRGNDKKFETA